MNDFLYHPFYCEENAWWLCQRTELGEGPRHVVFITNAQRKCLLDEQKASEPGKPIVWDYHVVVLADGKVWDLDSRLGMPVDVVTYLDKTFPNLSEELKSFAPMFRVVPADELVKAFHTDRSHMRGDDGSWVQPPPSWAPPRADGGVANQMRYVDLDDDIGGEVVDLDTFRARYSK